MTQTMMYFMIYQLWHILWHINYDTNDDMMCRGVVSSPPPPLKGVVNFLRGGAPRGFGQFAPLAKWEGWWRRSYLKPLCGEAPRSAISLMWQILNTGFILYQLYFSMHKADPISSSAAPNKWEIAQRRAMIQTQAPQKTMIWNQPHFSWCSVGRH